MKHKFDSEAELAAFIVAWVEKDTRKQVYQEVEIERGGPRADIVVVQEDCATVIETKLSPTIDGLLQAHRWRDDAQFIALAVPYIHDDERRELCKKIFEHTRVGLIMASEYISIAVSSPANHNASSRLIDHLIEHGADYKSGKFAKAGTKDGGHVTQCNVTLQALREYIENNWACPLKHAVSAINHHWRSNAIARSEITKLLKKNAIPGISYEESGGYITLYPQTEGAVK